MQLTELRPADGARKNKKRVGRGRGSGHGKTSTRGHNGQGQRSGESKRFGFEGGQTPLFRRLPKIHNFDQVERREWVEVNVGALNVLSANSEVSAEELLAHKILRKPTDSLRILGNGELKVALKVKAHHFSEGARKKIEAAGGTVEQIEATEVKGKRARRVERAIIAYENNKNAPKANVKEREERAAKKAERIANKKSDKPAAKGKGGQPPAGGQGKAQGGGGGGAAKKPAGGGDKGKPAKKK
jgi:large subunit ribosomal protein L15